MRTDTLDIKYSKYHEKWEVYYERSDVDRVTHVPIPSKMGFYHFARKTGVRKAFRQLKQHLIDDAKKEIERLNKYVEDIDALKLPQWIIEAEQKHRCKKKR